MSRLPLDLACTTCGYNMRGLELARPCPECGTPVRESITNWADRFDSRYVMSARSCAAAVAWTPLVWVIAAIIMVLLALATMTPVPVVLLLFATLPMSLFYWAAGYGFVSMARAMEDKRRAGLDYLIGFAAMPALFLVCGMGFGAEGAAINTLGLAAVQVPVWVMWRTVRLTQRFGGGHLVHACLITAWIVTIVTVVVFGTIMAMLYVRYTSGPGTADRFSGILTMAVNTPLGFLTLFASSITMVRVHRWLKQTAGLSDLRAELQTLLTESDADATRSPSDP